MIKKYYLFWVVIIISLPFRFYHFTHPLLDANYFRQTQTATIALNYYKTGIDLFRSELDIFGLGRERYLTLEFPLYQSVVSVFYQIFYPSEIWGRTVTIVAGVISTLYLYKLLILLTGKKYLAFIASLFFSFAPLNIFYLRSVMIDPFVIMLLLIGLYYSSLWLLKRERKDFLLGIIFLSLGFTHKGIYGPFWLFPLIRKDRLFLRLLLIVIPLMVLFLWQAHVNKTNYLYGHEFFTTGSKGQIEWNFGTIRDRFVLKAWLTRLNMLVNGIFLKPVFISFLIGLIFLKKYDRDNFLLSWFLSQVLYFIVFFRIQQHTYYQLAMVPVFSSISAIGFYQVLSILPSRKLVTSLILALFFVFFIYKSWVNSLPSFYIDWQFYKRLMTVKDVISPYRAGILVTAGYDWNSVYTYIPAKKMLLVEEENINDKNLVLWKELGYDFLLLVEPKKFHLTSLEGRTRLLLLEDFEVYLL